MNPTTEPQPLPLRPSTSCLRHPQEQNFTGFCPLCLNERLSLLNPPSKKLPSSSSSSSIKSIFKPSSSFFPELRRSKSFSASKNEGFSGIFEPQRKSCDVRTQNTLFSLFTQTQNDPQIEFSQRPNSGNVVENITQEIFEEEVEEGKDPEAEKDEEGLKTMKDHIFIDSQMKKNSGGKDLKEIAGSFWSAASVFSKKLQKWREKQKVKKQRNGSGSTTLPVEKPIGRHFRETQSEIADYGFGRRSCDIDPRFSLDAGRMSFDDPRYSFDEPRASWDGYLISRTFPRMPTMLSVVEDAPVRSDIDIPVEEQDEDGIPGGSSQTREYYSDSSSRRRKSLDRSNSIRKTAAAVVAEIDEMKLVSNSKVSPTIVDRDLNSNSNSNSLRDDCSASATIDSTFNDGSSVINSKETKKSRRWGKGWNIWGLINRRSGNKENDGEVRFNRPNGVERSYSESWPELRGERSIDAKGGLNPKMVRSNSSVSWRNSNMISGSRKSNAEAETNNGSNGRKKKEDIVLERSRSARHSPTNVDNGLLRFYLAPMRGSRKGGSGSGKVKQNQAQSIARSVLRLY